MNKWGTMDQDEDLFIDRVRRPMARLTYTLPHILPPRCPDQAILKGASVMNTLKKPMQELPEVRR